jgi:integrase
MKVAVKAFSKWLGRSAVVGDLTKPTVLRYIHAMTNGHLSPASVQTHLERILALWRFAAHNRWVADYPDIKPVHVPARTPEAWERDQLSMILDAARATTGKFGNVPRKLFWEALVRFLYDSGERIGAALAVRHDDISGEWINVRAELRKGRTRDKTYKLRPETLAAIAEIRKHDDGPLIFAWPLVRTYLWRLYGDLLVAAGLPSNRRSKFHKIRRTTASHFESAGGNSTELLDHDSRKTTKRSYLDPRQIKTVMPADIVPGIGQDTPPPPAEPTAADLLAKLQHLLK